MRYLIAVAGLFALSGCSFPIEKKYLEELKLRTHIKQQQAALESEKVKLCQVRVAHARQCGETCPSNH